MTCGAVGLDGMTCEADMGHGGPHVATLQNEHGPVGHVSWPNRNPHPPGSFLAQHWELADRLRHLGRVFVRELRSMAARWRPR